ncbi:Rv1157c family protein [Mycolicibacterium komossense]|uniref:Uncharacterized protein n=1 Tax=Mycolicibacterium komossense TaxID=1779 RepID=A0ABT3CKC6_9MYCO|nr:hypothetical protein [Mycolicibacterium komossense]MCV7229929.1 hypothetical protein [Mycolicibacterium komossense]
MSTRTLFATTAVAMGSSVALLLSGVATADPTAPLPLPIDGLSAPGLPAVQSLSPAIQQAAADPSNAASMLMAAAAAFAGNQAAPADSQGLASAVSQFVSSPAAAAVVPSPSTVPGTGIPLPNNAAVPGPAPLASNLHVPPPGVIPGTEAHLLPGVDPSHAVGPDPATAAPAPAAPPAAAPVAAAPAPTAGATPLAASTPAPGPATGASTGPNTAPPGYAPDTPPTQDFMYPSIGNNCLPDGGNSIATALSVAGPANIPTPGPAASQTAYVFTAVGTSGPADVQKLPLNVTWVNLTTGKSGSATLKPRPDINPNGPTTLTAVVDTGSGSIMSTIFGQVTTTDKQCQFMPTIGSTVVP